MTKALQDAQDAVKINPNETEAHYVLGRIFLIDGDASKAFDHLTTYLNFFPNDADGLEYRGIALAQNGKLDKAIQDFVHAESVAPGNPGPFYSHARALFEAKRFNEALPKIMRAMELAVPAEDSYFIAGVCFFEQKDYLASLTHLNLYLDAVGPDPKGLEIRAKVYDALGQQKKAARDQERAQKIRKRKGKLSPD